MKRFTLNSKSLLLILCVFVPETPATAQDATEIIRKADTKFQGEKSSYSLMTMTIKRPKWERTLAFKSWTLGNDYALTLITSPAKEAGQSFLKVNNEMWNWSPTISRMIKLPPSMLSQGWMGSDYTNDDLLRESSLVKDYNHKITSTERIDAIECWKIELLPKDDAAVVWGKVIKWISKSAFDQLKTEYYDEDNVLIRTEYASGIKKMDDRIVPTIYEIVPADKPDCRTILILNEVKFNPSLKENFFSQQNMKNVK
ncbi:MAG: outer membrane lipoprotein-sorting protein [Bacteroidales bacterium]